MPPFQLTDKTAVITGAGSGIGAAIARLFADQGAAVAVLDIDETKAAEVASEITEGGGRARAIVCDVTDSTTVTRAIDTVVGEWGRLDILVNNAGIAHIGTVESTTDEDMDRIFDVNVKGVHICTRAAIPKMVEQGGGVVLNLASIASLLGLKDRFAYSMSKGAVLTMTKSVAIDYIDKGIRCNCVCPARIHTPFVDGYLAANYPGAEDEMFAKLSAYQPIGRMGKPEEVAALCLYLCSDEAAFVTGQAYPIDGGVLLV